MQKIGEIAFKNGGSIMKKYLLNVIPFIIVGICFLAYNVIGSEVLADGTLSEPFYLIPMAYLFVLIGLVWLIVNVVSLFIKKNKLDKLN